MSLGNRHRRGEDRRVRQVWGAFVFARDRVLEIGIRDLERSPERQVLDEEDEEEPEQLRNEEGLEILPLLHLHDVPSVEQVLVDDRRVVAQDVIDGLPHLPRRVDGEHGADDSPLVPFRDVEGGPHLRGLLRHVPDHHLHPAEVALDAAVQRETGQVRGELAGRGTSRQLQQPQPLVLCGDLVVQVLVEDRLGDFRPRRARVGHEHVFGQVQVQALILFDGVLGFGLLVRLVVHLVVHLLVLVPLLVRCGAMGVVVHEVVKQVPLAVRDLEGFPIEVGRRDGLQVEGRGLLVRRARGPARKLLDHLGGPVGQCGDLLRFH